MSSRTSHVHRIAVLAASATLTAGLVAAPVTTPAYAAEGANAAKASVAAKAKKQPTLHPGMTGRKVAKLQRLLRVRPVSGWYGPITRKAVKKFKRSHGLGAGPTVDAPVWKALLRDRARTATPAAASASGLVCPAPKAHFSDDYGDARSGHVHAGIDMLGRRGMELYAIEDGYVVREGRQSNGALRIVIQGTQTGAKYYYGHNSKHLVRAGERFKAGAVLGLMGDTGSPGINHLHFEWWKSGGESDHVNPYNLLRRIC